MYFETNRLILRKPELFDVEDYLEFVNSEFVMRYNAMSPVTLEKAQRQCSDPSSLAITLKETGKIIGMICLNDDSLRYGVESREISYFLREEAARLGYMKEALGALIDHLFTQENLVCIAARSFVPNIASQRLLESLGFHKDGIVPKCVKGYKDIVFDDCLYSLMRENWQKSE